MKRITGLLPVIFCFILLIILFLVSGFIPGLPSKGDSGFSEIYKDIFQPLCANTACHGGGFEPNLGSPYSAFNTLVYHPVVKNNHEKGFKYRVVPFDTSSSLLYERITNCCFVNSNDRMPQSKIGGKLSEFQISMIAEWILAGAPDLLGNLAKKPIQPPVINQSFILKNSQGINLNDTAYREGKLQYGSILISPGQIISFWFNATDEIVPTRKMSEAFLVLKANSQEDSVVKVIKAIRKENNWVVSMNTKELDGACLWYFQFKIVDGLTGIFPDENTPLYIRQTWSVKLNQP